MSTVAPELAASSAGAGPDTSMWAVPGLESRHPEESQSRALLAETEDALQQLFEAIARVRRVTENLGGVEAIEVAEHLACMQNQLGALHLRAVLSAVEGGAWIGLGHARPVDWVRESHRIDHAVASSMVRDARWLQEHPQFQQALSEGSISVSHVTAVRRVAARREARQAAFPGFAEDLLEVARHSTPERTASIMRAWANRLDPGDEDDHARDIDDRRQVYLSPVGDVWDLKGTLPGLSGAKLAGVLNQIMESQRRRNCTCQRFACTCASDERTRPQARADALIALVEGAMGPDGSILAPNGAARSRAILVIRAADLASEPGERTPSEAKRPESGSEPDDFMSVWRTSNGPGSGLLCRASVLQELCDATVQRLIVGPESQPLDIGRATRVIPAAVRTAVIVRDRGCIFPGCAQPFAWTEAHHIRHWAHGGETAVSNLALLCSRHHVAIHSGRWTIRMTDDQIPQVYRTAFGPPG